MPPPEDPDAAYRRYGMRPTADREPLVFVEFTREAFANLADRLSEADRFEELVYRESELDALFSIADVTLRTSRAATTTEPGALPIGPPLTTADLERVRDLVAQAHDLLHDDQLHRAAALLREAAQLL